MTVWIMSQGQPYEGSSTQSVHKTKKGAVTAAFKLMKDEKGAWREQKHLEPLEVMGWRRDDGVHVEIEEVEVEN